MMFRKLTIDRVNRNPAQLSRLGLCGTKEN
jgi:hypothetical protein